MSATLKSFGKKADRFAYRPPEYDRRITVLEGAVRSSKTYSMHPKTLYLARYEVGGVGVFTGVSKQTIYNNVLRDLFNIIGERNYTYNRMTGELDLFGSKWVVIGAKDEGSEKYIRGLTVGKAICDELVLMPKSFVFMLINRMSPAGARMYATTNPDNPFHYVKTDLIDNQDLRERHDLEVIHYDLDDNPNLNEEYKKHVRSFYKGVWYQRYILGLWVAAEGSIYTDCWSDELLYDDASRPPGLLSPDTGCERFVTVDYGTDHPMVYLDCYDDGRTLWVEREYVWDSHVEHRQKTDGEYADDLERFLAARYDYNAKAWVDGSQANQAASSLVLVVVPPDAASFEAELRARGVWITTADNEVLDGIRMTASMMARRLVRVHKDNCPRLVARIPAYVWNPKPSERGKEEPLMKNDDEVSALRYGIKTRINSWRLAA